ncbi:hypothetical protein BCR41DRAFT_315 [Lobosporangium transversale]|uniref:Uncharacterized protein n=1 Tax=Lobosporangium transversale TaxID=64571 RepID=A0A1Y2H212_9FUNG|nr:hypothetical protein BCR41DRAFT_315 [Lobosporangium transversale]ORZ28609.1 hypothetical protein BCR41DRAFT_315 [Lobosporangium transversale]|eukprot:XP_021886282.1 hypothetical protein BCR41DRAFT_315 [Lobosporangium transversale]
MIMDIKRRNSGIDSHHLLRSLKMYQKEWSKCRERCISNHCISLNRYATQYSFGLFTLFFPQVHMHWSIIWINDQSVSLLTPFAPVLYLCRVVPGVTLFLYCCLWVDH